MDLAVVRQLKDGALDTTSVRTVKSPSISIPDFIGAPLLTHRHDFDKKRDDSLAASAGGIGATPFVNRMERLSWSVPFFLSSTS